MRYDYLCTNDDCQFEFEIEQTVSEEKLTTCPACGDTIERVIMEPPMSFMKHRTIGALADKNTREMGRYKFDSVEKSHADRFKAAKQARIENLRSKLPPGAKLPESYEHKPWYGKLSEDMKKVNDPQKIHKYIMDGKE